MNFKAILVVLLVVIVVVGGGIFVYGLGQYNHAIQLDEQVKQQWAQVDVQLQRRFDLIPNLEATVKGIAGQEQKVFLGIAEARKAYFQAQTVPEKVEGANQLNTALSRLLLLQEQYPQLKSNESFLKLQDSIEGTENRISVERGRYNEVVRQLDVFARTFPHSFFAGLAGVQRTEYLKTPEAVKAPPKVDFSKP